MSVEDKAELIIAVRNYKFKSRKKRIDGVDFTVSDTQSDEKVLLRSIEPQAKAGYVGLDDVKKMLEVMKSQDCDRGVIIGKRFTVAAAEQMALEKIQQVSDEYMPPIKPENLYFTVNDCVNSLCKAKCGRVPLKNSDCKAYLEAESCRVRSISVDALFHFERGWINLLKNDLKQLLSLYKSLKTQ
jgi:hypothetical protein